MKKLSVFVLVLFTLTAANAAAQGSPQPPPASDLNLEMRQPATMSPDAVRSSLRPFAKQAFKTKEDVVQATRDCLKKDLFFVGCHAMVVLANKRFKLGIDEDELNTTLGLQAGLDKVADYLMTTVVTDVPQERRGKLDAAKSDGTIAEGAVRRIAVPNEPGLYDTTAGRWVLSLMCGNFIVDWGNYYTRASEAGSGGVLATGNRLAAELARENRDLDQRRAQLDADRSPSHGNFFSLDRGTGKAFWFGVVPAAIVGSAIAYHGWESGPMVQCYGPGSPGMICQSR